MLRTPAAGHCSAAQRLTSGAAGVDPAAAGILASVRAEGVPGRVRRSAANLLLFAVSSAVGLAGLELAFRMARERAGGGKEQGEEARYLRYDPLLGWSKIPGARVTYDRREYRVDVVINDKGLRDVPRSYRPEPGVARVLAVGDSFLEQPDARRIQQIQRESDRDGLAVVERMIRERLESMGRPVAEIKRAGGAALERVAPGRDVREVKLGGTTDQSLHGAEITIGELGDV